MIENSFSKAQFKQNKGYQNGTVRLIGLEAGDYVIKLHEIREEISLTVHRGTYWETDSFILKPHSMIEVRENQSFIRITDIKLSAPVEGSTEQKIRFSIQGHKEFARVHLYAFQFMPNNIYELY